MPRLVIRGYGGRPTLAPVDITGETFFDVLRAYLKSRDELADITEVYYRRTKPGVAFPHIIISPIGDSPEINNSETYWERSDIQFTVLASGADCDEQAEALGQAAYKALAPKRKNDAGVIVAREKLISTYAYEMAALPGMKYRAEQPGRGTRNEPVFAFYFSYQFLVGRSMVAN